MDQDPRMSFEPVDSNIAAHAQARGATPASPMDATISDVVETVVQGKIEPGQKSLTQRSAKHAE